MDLEIQGFSLTDLSKQTKTAASSKDHEFQNAEVMETSVIKSVLEDNKLQLLSLSKKVVTERTIFTKLFHLCCTFDSVDCATSLLNGEFGSVPVINEPDSTGLSPLHAAATANAARCVEMLLEKHARTDLKSRDGRRLLPLELSLCITRKDLIWDLDDNSTIEDLVVQISEKDLTTLKLLADKTEEIGDLAYRMAEAGRVVDLAALLVVAADKINESILPVRDAVIDCKEKTTIYEAVIIEALALGGPTPLLRAAKRVTVLSESERAEKRKLLLYEIELLQLFGADGLRCCTDRKLPSPLIRAAQAGDETIIELLLKTNIDLNDVDADGHSALHWCLKAYKQSCPQQMKIMWLLLKHGARVNQENKLGFTAVHIAASNGNSQALQALLLEDPDCVNSNTEMKETPLFFAVKNGCKDCVDVLLHWGASTGVFNLRKQRPVDLAESQDMRFMLNNADVNLINRPIQQKYTAWLQGGDVIQGTCEELFTLTDERNPTNRTCSSTKKEICKYFYSPRGCVRGTKCFYAHSEEERQQVKQGRYMIHSPAAGQLERKIFVGGLPASVDSDSLRKILEEKFGSVDNAAVLGVQTADKMQSRGFGFVTFKDKNSVSAAVEAHHVIIMGKQVEIKSAVPKFLLLAEFQKSTQQRERNQIDEKLPQAQMLKEKTEKEKAKTDVLNRQTSSEKTEKVILSCNSTEEIKSEPRTWADTLIHGQTKACSSESQTHERCMPKWFRTLRRWLPSFLQQASKRGGQYALSSVKADFRALFGLELDHASLGFSKLSDFMKSIPELCHITYHTPANHMILLPSLPIPCQQPLQDVTIDSPSSHSTSIGDSGNGNSDGSICSQEHLLVSIENDDLNDSSTRGSFQITDDNPIDKLPCVNSRFRQFLKPDPIFHARPWVNSDSDGDKESTVGERGGSGKGFQEMKPWPQGRHLVLEALARKKNSSSVYFLREFDFCDEYEASIAQGRCLGCNERRMLRANFPCLHLVWCADCKLQAMMAARLGEHKCVVCDIKVQTIDLISRHEYCQPILDTACIKEFPPFDPDYMLNSIQEEAYI
ncbi:PREDICTED: uncharacterized protein LOC105117663 isoform X6 [Populus euphratica]|uniref:Uncharacterized protein LOC105117663 isoform X6 n=1 Tax=Populus euphratica TaxID=75702 RepID=A0AAJ6TLS1_POPEU|nr:PREDICTED: uncharacterized protein LOC105117663 isoform X6 [Populus euphratica]